MHSHHTHAFVRWHFLVLYYLFIYRSSVATDPRSSGIVCLPYMQDVSEEVWRVLQVIGLKEAFRPSSWKWQLMAEVKVEVLTKG